MMLWVFLALSSVGKCIAEKQQSELETERVTVQTSRGIIRGFHVNNNLLQNLYQGEADVFLGIPYAIPPTGERKFKKSEVIGKYDKIIEANKFSNICPQKEEEPLPKVNDVAISEDCLSLNIYAPSVSEKSNKYPVMVYIHGGALTTGNAEMWMYHGIISNIVRRDVIWVSINYRVGFHGFFTTCTEEFPPNRGIWDQITALQWIHEEIANFGGDPKKITVIGHSAGACSASYLALSPAVNPGLVSKVIMMSASAEICFEKIYGEFTQSLDRAEQICNISARDGWTEEKVRKMLHCVLLLNHTQISAYDANTFRWNAVVDGELFTGPPSEMHWRDLPVLSGSTFEEYAVYEQWKLLSGIKKMDDYKDKKNGWEKQIKWWIEKIYGKENVEAIMSEVKREYTIPQEYEESLIYMKYVIRVLSDLIYIHAVGAEAEMRVKGGLRNNWLWQLNFRTDYFSFYRIKNYKPVFHGIDLFLLMQPDYAWVNGEKSQKWNNEELQVADEIATEFTQFAKHGYPSKEWEPLDTNRMNYWRIDYYGNGKVDKQRKYPDEYGGKHYKFWKNISSFYRNVLTKKLETKSQKPTPISILTTMLFCVITFYIGSVILKIIVDAKPLRMNPVPSDSASKK